eukprot:1964562-Alexandrium_andersonii.AAC.1
MHRGTVWVFAGIALNMSARLFTLGSAYCTADPWGTNTPRHERAASNFGSFAGRSIAIGGATPPE